MREETREQLEQANAELKEQVAQKDRRIEELEARLMGALRSSLSVLLHGHPRPLLHCSSTKSISPERSLLDPALPSRWTDRPLLVKSAHLRSTHNS
jgi:hypothetical protein